MVQLPNRKVKREYPLEYLAGLAWASDRFSLVEMTKDELGQLPSAQDHRLGKASSQYLNVSVSEFQRDGLV